MRSLMITLAALFATSAFANTSFDAYEGTYQSRGTWKDVTGMEDSWISTLIFSREEGRDDELVVVINEFLAVQNGEETTEMTETLKLHHRANGFFDVRIEGESVGSAYCFGRHCHIAYETAEGKTEKSLIFNDENTQIAMTGSGIYGDYFFSWSGISVRTKK